MRAALAAVLALALGAACSWAIAGASASSRASAPIQFVPQGGKLVPASGEERGAGFFGRAVALSADGNTAVISAPHDNGESGAAFVFVRDGAIWLQQAKLAVGKEGSSFFGRGVALSADGSTALIGDPGTHANTGTAWVFTRSGSTWTKQAQLNATGEEGAGQFGRSVALSGDGLTALVGGYADAKGAGAAWAFTRSGSSWSPLGAKLTGGGEAGAGFFGRGVALSQDGSTAAIGGEQDNAGAGALWIFTRSGGAFSQQGAKLAGGEEGGAGELGGDVALSSDGGTALAGGIGDEGERGAAWVFTRSGSSWSQQGPKLTGSGEFGAGEFGFSVSLSGEGSLALIGAANDAEKAGAAFVFSRSGATWTQQGAKLTGAEEVGPGLFGYGAALSGDGSTAIVGGIGDNSRAGAAWPFVRAASHEPPPEEEPPAEEHKGETTHEQHTTATTASTSTTTTGTGAVLATTQVGSPVLAHSGNVQPVAGKVLIKLPGTNTFVPLDGLRQIPYGTVVDATSGRVQVTSALPHGALENGEFFAGDFVLSQGSSGVVTVTLTGGASGACPAHHAHSGRAHSSAKHGHTVRRLWANAHGTFTTKGSYAAGAVQGTEWLTEDRCNGTLIKVTRDKVKVTDLVHHRTFIVRAGHSVFVSRR